MNDQSLTISESAALELIALGLVGLMTEETFTELKDLHLSVRTTSQSVLQDGLVNSSSNASTLVHNWAQSYIKDAAQQTEANSTQQCRCECSCNSSRKQVTNNA